MRGRIALLLIGLFMLVVVMSFLLFLLSPRPADEIKDLLILVIPPLSSLVGAVVGFYYGSIRGRD